MHPFLGWIPPKNSVLNLGSHCDIGRQLEYRKIKTDEYNRSITPLNLENPEYRIVVTGGGYVMGTGSTNDGSIPSVLERELYERYNIKAEVTNLGVGGYNSFQEMLILSDYFLENKADFVISIASFNDYINGIDDAAIGSALMNSWVHENVQYLNEKKSFFSFICDRSFFLQIVKNLFPHLIGRAKEYIAYKFSQGNLYVDDKVAPTILNNVAKRVAITNTHYSMINVLANKNKAKFMLFLTPQVFTKNKLTQHEKDCSESRLNLQGKRVSNVILKGYGKKYLENIKVIDKEYEFYDITDIFNDTDETMFFDMFAYSNTGVRKIIQSIISVILPQIIVNSKQATK